MTGKQIGGLIVLAILGLGLASEDNQSSNAVGKLILICIGFVIVICVIAKIMDRHPRPMKSNGQKIPNKPISYSTADGFISSLKPSLLSGTFVCKACGASTSFRNELYPKTCCAYCGSGLPEVQQMIIRRDSEYQEALNQEHKLYNERRTREENLELSKEQMHYNTEQLKIRERMEEKRQEHQTKRTEMILAFICVVVFILLLLVFRKR